MIYKFTVSSEKVLQIAKEIAEAHGGKITVADTPGGGTRFFLLLKSV